jgi:hypothetical protein
LEPPQGALLFSVGALPVREQAIAINPSLPTSEVRTACAPANRNQDMELLLLLLLLQQQQQSQKAAAPRAAAVAPTTGMSPEFEERLMRMIEAQVSSQIGQ